MFEHEQEAVSALLEADPEFRHIYGKHQKLKERVAGCNGRITELDDLELEHLKKQKLHLKDRMARKIREYRAV